MSIEGLYAILDKEEVVATQGAADLIAHPDLVDSSYQRHVRTYVPFSREASGGDGQSVPAFEKKVIRDIKAGNVVRGYITAEYGHGKTSTALYLWERARQDNLLAVPPFQFNHLTDLARATYGWARYEIGRTRPGTSLLTKVETTFKNFNERSAEAYSQKYDISLPTAHQIIRDKPEIVELGASDYIAFFETMTALAKEAGYEGLLVLADEMQQYIDPQVKAGTKDPIAPFFDIINSLITRQGRLAMGLLVIIPPRELEVLRDQRGDVVHRLLQASLDLRTIYDQEFPSRLWGNLAKAHDFVEYRDRIISPEALSALGQIGARDDLSDGPRTIVNTFRRATSLYLDGDGPHKDPYTPESLVDDLLTGNIHYDSSKRIPTVAARALDHTLVKGRPEHERAIKWAAAFPNEGVTRDIQERHGLAMALDELAQSALGDLVISIGNQYNKGFTLAGLEAKPVSTDWLSINLREFGRNYVDTADAARQRAMRGFLMLLQRKAFPDNQWKVESFREGRLTQDAGLIFKGAFTGSRQSHPERYVHVRVLWEDDQVKDADIEGDALVEIRLRRYLHLPESERRIHEEPTLIDPDGRAIRLTLNLMGQTVNISPNLETTLGAFVSPYKLTPQLLLNLYDLFDEKLRDASLGRTERQQIEHMIQPDLLESSFRQLFNETVGRPVEAAEERLLESALLGLFRAIYPDYKPLMVVPSWRNSLQKYENALKLLDSNYERQGQVDVERTKDDLAQMFTLSNTTLDNFARNFPALIEGVNSLPGKGSGSVRFSLHPLEQAIKKWLADSPEKQQRTVAGQTVTVHTLSKQAIYAHGRAQGYQQDEIEAVTNLMFLRGLIEEDTRLGVWRQAVNIVPSVDELEAEIDAVLNEVTMLREGFPDDRMPEDWHNIIIKSKERLSGLRKQPDDKALDANKRGIRALRQQVESYLGDKQRSLHAEAEDKTRLIPPVGTSGYEKLKTPIVGSVEYVYQVNEQLRTPLLKTNDKLENDSAALRQKVDLTRVALQGETLSVQTLLEETKALRSHVEAIARLGNRRQEFEKQFREYMSWAELVASGNTLSELLNQMGDLVAEQRLAFEAISRDIRGHLSAYKLDALPDSTTYSVRISELSANVQAVRTNVNRQFTELQDRYRQEIYTALHFPSDRLWSLHHLNPLAYDDSYTRLFGDVQSTVSRTIIGHFQTLIDDMRSAIRSTLQSPLIRQLSQTEQDQIQQRGHGLHTQLESLNRELETARKQATLATVKDFPEAGGGEFKTLLQQLSKVSNGIIQCKQPTTELGQSLQKLELEGSEQAVLDIILSGSKMTDLSAVRQSSQLADGEFWRALSGLHAKRRVRLIIERVSNE